MSSVKLSLSILEPCLCVPKTAADVSSSASGRLLGACTCVCVFQKQYQKEPVKAGREWKGRENGTRRELCVREKERNRTASVAAAAAAVVFYRCHSCPIIINTHYIIFSVAIIPFLPASPLPRFYFTQFLSYFLVLLHFLFLLLLIISLC